MVFGWLQTNCIPVRLLQSEDVNSAVTTGGAKQRRLHLKGGESQGMDGSGPGPTPKGVHLVCLHQGQDPSCLSGLSPASHADCASPMQELLEHGESPILQVLSR